MSMGYQYLTKTPSLLRYVSTWTSSFTCKGNPSLSNHVQPFLHTTAERSQRLLPSSSVVSAYRVDVQNDSVEPKCLQHPTNGKLGQGRGHGAGGYVVTVRAAGDDGESCGQEEGVLKATTSGEKRLRQGGRESGCPKSRYQRVVKREKQAVGFMWHMHGRGLNSLCSLRPQSEGSRIHMRDWKVTASN